MTLAIDLFIAAYLLIAVCSHAPRQSFRNWLLRPVLPLVQGLGLGQSWTMFTPDPPRASRHLQVIVRREQGDALVWEPPRMDRLSRWQAFLRFRYREYASTILCGWAAPCRPALAEYLLRRYDFGDNAPVEVVLTYVERPVPPPGSADAPVPETRHPCRVIVHTHAVSHERA
jgi:hypothetical protein